ncbi:hypothetical protein VP1G_03813 [Cytospora mali]|uniref:Ecp2 effector protein-like domain-containing protein n=1 Tax=Cytospora mali TaxID=578113 RepID=A0A194UXX4_CYTMA|nr:hypothetical protein VP1G_03813 [Valsa mali var. pyri (nom. inval.)]
MKLFVIITFAAWSYYLAAGMQARSSTTASSTLDKRTADVRFNPGANGGGPQIRCNDITYSPGEPEDKIWGVDCDALTTNTTDLHGLYMFQDWKFDGDYTMLWGYGTCNIGVYRSDGKDSYTQVGDEDLRKILTYCNKYMRSSYTMVKTVTGTMKCAGLQGAGNAAMNWTLRSGT